MKLFEQGDLFTKYRATAGTDGEVRQYCRRESPYHTYHSASRLVFQRRTPQSAHSGRRIQNGIGSPGKTATSILRSFFEPARFLIISLFGRLQVHSHETVWSVKQKIASLLRTSADQLMLVIGDRPSPPGNLNPAPFSMKILTRTVKSMDLRINRICSSYQSRSRTEIAMPFRMYR